VTSQAEGKSSAERLLEKEVRGGSEAISVAVQLIEARRGAPDGPADDERSAMESIAGARHKAEVGAPLLTHSSFQIFQ